MLLRPAPGRFSRTPHLSEDRGSQPSAHSVGLAAAKALGANSLAELRAAPVEAIAALNVRAQENVDGWVLPDEIRNIFAAGKQNNVPVIVGSTADEMTSLGVANSAPKSLAEFRQRIRQQYGDFAEEFEQVYQVKSEADIVPALLAAGRDTTFSSHMRQWARATTSAGSAAYLYSFEHIPPHPQKDVLKAFHASELPYVFNVIPSQDPREAGFAYTDADRRMAAAMSTYWTNFVATGDPNGKGLPRWPAYDIEREPYLRIADPISVGNHLLKRELDFLERALARRP
jgi:para-nitrobenzyl esterase